MRVHGRTIMNETMFIAVSAIAVFDVVVGACLAAVARSLGVKLVGVLLAAVFAAMAVAEWRGDRRASAEREKYLFSHGVTCARIAMAERGYSTGDQMDVASRASDLRRKFSWDEFDR